MGASEAFRLAAARGASTLQGMRAWAPAFIVGIAVIWPPIQSMVVVTSLLRPEEHKAVGQSDDSEVRNKAARWT